MEDSYTVRVNKWILLLILDGFGIGEAEDAHSFGDTGADTCGHLLSCQPALRCPTLEAIGLFDPEKRTVLKPENPNKDTLSGIHELFGVILPKWTTFPEGLPDSLLRRFESLIHNEVINAGKGSGTEIINRLGSEHFQTGNPIVYTSADSVFQIAAHEERVPLSTLYYWASLARSLVNDQPALGRVIARPFIGDSRIGFSRTPQRKDFPYKTATVPLLEELSKQSVLLSGNRIIQDLFPQTKMDPVPGQHIADTMEQLLILLRERRYQEDISRLCVVDLEDFDMLYGHRRDPNGYISALIKFDGYLNQCLSLLRTQDLCILTADHGNDPTFTLHTDHTRENVPLVSVPLQPSYQGIHPMSIVASIIKHYFSLS